jgi:hypothetical protein
VAARLAYRMHRNGGCPSLTVTSTTLLWNSDRHLRRLDYCY